MFHIPFTSIDPRVFQNPEKGKEGDETPSEPSGARKAQEGEKKSGTPAGKSEFFPPHVNNWSK